MRGRWFSDRVSNMKSYSPSVRGSITENAKEVRDFEQDPYKDRIVVCVLVYIFREDGKLLLLKRKNPPYSGYWETVGGKVEFLEPLEKAAMREVKEEAGIEIDESSLQFVGVFQHIVKAEKYHRVLIVYAVKVPVNVEIKVSEHDEFGWFDINNLPEKVLCGPIDDAYRIVFGGSNAEKVETKARKHPEGC